MKLPKWLQKALPVIRDVGTTAGALGVPIAGAVGAGAGAINRATATDEVKAAHGSPDAPTSDQQLLDADVVTAERVDVLELQMRQVRARLGMK